MYFLKRSHCSPNCHTLSIWYYNQKQVFTCAQCDCVFFYILFHHLRGGLLLLPRYTVQCRSGSPRTWLTSCGVVGTSERRPRSAGGTGVKAIIGGAACQWLPRALPLAMSRTKDASFDGVWGRIALVFLLFYVFFTFGAKCDFKNFENGTSKWDFKHGVKRSVNGQETRSSLFHPAMPMRS